MPIRNFDHARVASEKLSDYLLNLFHPIGGSKARWFVARGFSPDEPEILGDALVGVAKNSEQFETVETDYGVKYTVFGKLNCPDGSTPAVKTVWMSSPNDFHPLLVTAYPDKTS